MNPNKSVTSHLSDTVIVLIVVFLMVLSFAIGLKWEKKTINKSQQSASLHAPADWSAYENKEYGFGFIYPNSFGKPLVNTKAGTTGHTYHITFPSAKGNAIPEINMTTDDYKDKICTADKKCHDITNQLNKAYVTNTLKSYSNIIVVQDDSSFAMVASGPSGAGSTLGLDQIVSLEKSKISAVSLQIKKGGSNCPNQKFSTDLSSGCIVQNDYDTLNQIAKSIKEI